MSKAVAATVRRLRVSAGRSRVGRLHDLKPIARRIALAGGADGFRLAPCGRLGGATTLYTRLPLTALQRVLASRQPTAALMKHMDRGNQYATRHYWAVLRAHGAFCVERVVASIAG